MKTFCVLALLASVSAFAPVPTGRTSTAQAALADRVFNLDLFNYGQNDYGARKGKNLKVGKISDKSYIPSGLTKAQYEKIRTDQQKAKDANYARNVAKAGKFIDFTEWYADRGTELGQAWRQSVTLGHRMAKTKFDWSGIEDAKKFESTSVKPIFSAKKPVAKKAVAKAPFGKKTAAPKKKFFNY